MKKTVLIIVLAMIATALFPTQVLAYETIGVTGDWTCEYEINDYGVGASGGTGVVRLKVKNTAPSSSTDIIKYVSVSYGSEFYEVQSTTIAPTRDMILEFSIPIDESDSGRSNTLWVGMSTRGESNVDGIGAVTGVVFGPDPVYDANLVISTSTSTINQGETVGIAYGGSNIGNRTVDVEVYDQFGVLVFSMEDMDILYLGKEEYTPEHTTTYQFTLKIYKPNSRTVYKEVVSEPLTVTVIAPATPEPVTPEIESEPAVTPEPETEITEAPTATLQPTVETVEYAETTQAPETEIALDAESDDNDEIVVMDAGGNSSGMRDAASNQNTLWSIIVILLFLITFGMIGIIIYLIRTNKSQQ